MPRGGARIVFKPEVVPMEDHPCHGAGALLKPHKFKRAVGSHRHQCSKCFEASAKIRDITVYREGNQ